MRGMVTAGLAASVIGSGVWAYKENYATQEALRDVRALQGQIDATQARLDRLEAEWAYLNRPDRLRDLAELNFRRLELQPMRPEAFASVDEVPMPGAAVPLLSSFVVSEAGMGTEEPL